MKNVLIIGASGNIATKVTALLSGKPDIALTLLVRNKNRLRIKDLPNARIVADTAMDAATVKEAVKGQDIVYVNLAGDLEAMATNILAAMRSEGVPKVIFISSIGIYDNPLKPVLVPYRKGADVIEASGLDYTILRPAWFTNADEVDYETTVKGEAEKGSVISQQSLAALIACIIEHPDEYSHANLGVNKPDR